MSHALAQAIRAKRRMTADLGSAVDRQVADRRRVRPRVNGTAAGYDVTEKEAIGAFDATPLSISSRCWFTSSPRPRGRW
jgi:hypothetical protein